MIKNQIVSQQSEKKKNGFSAVINQPNFQGAILNTLQDKNAAKRFTASIISAVTATPTLKECDPMSIISAGLLGEALKLSPSPQRGQYYLVPFKQKAQFILGYKGYIQLA
ncbi:MAG: recombinase RecT, partial [Ruminococcus sp.]|nr:recombinase RecT [Ruminococcus sp.]